MRQRLNPTRATDAFYKGFKHRVVAMANASRALITSDFSTVRGIVDAAPLVFGVFQDATQPDGVGLLLVKGHALLREVVASGRTLPVDMAAVPCTCAEQAEALRLVAGENDKLH